MERELAGEREVILEKTHPRATVPHDLTWNGTRAAAVGPLRANGMSVRLNYVTDLNES